MMVPSIYSRSRDDEVATVTIRRDLPTNSLVSSPLASEGGNRPPRRPRLRLSRFRGEAACEQMRKLLVEFGLTPSSRSRIRLVDRGPNSNLDDFLEEGRSA